MGSADPKNSSPRLCPRVNLGQNLEMGKKSFPPGESPPLTEPLSQLVFFFFLILV